MTRSTTTSPPSAAEILALLTMAGDLREDPRTTDADRLAYFECKADLRERIVAHNRTGAALDAARHARGQVRRLHDRSAAAPVSGRW